MPKLFALFHKKWSFMRFLRRLIVTKWLIKILAGVEINAGRTGRASRREIGGCYSYFSLP